MHVGNKLANQNGWTKLIHIKTSAQTPVWQFPLLAPTGTPSTGPSSPSSSQWWWLDQNNSERSHR